MKRLLALTISAGILTSAATSPASADWLRKGYGYGLGHGGGWHDYRYHRGGFHPGIALGAVGGALVYDQIGGYYTAPPIYHVPPQAYYARPRVYYAQPGYYPAPVYYQRGW